MKASEIRIGNLVLKDGNEILITPYDLINIELSLNEYEPIPLTEEWLLRFGFDVDNRPEWINQLQKYEIICRGVHYLKGCENQTTPIKYVHQLQNLYFALTGEELTIK